MRRRGTRSSGIERIRRRGSAPGSRRWTLVAELLVMDRFVAYKLSFECETITPLVLPWNNGPTLRGAFFSALRRDFCLNKNVDSCLHCPTAEVCPICKLVATVDRDSPRGAEVVRPFALEPILPSVRRYEAGETFSFGITLFGKSLALFPYVILAAQRMGELGMGNKAISPGRFRLKEACTINPLTTVKKRIYSPDSRLVNVPDAPITHDDVMAYSQRLGGDRVRLGLVTPLRLILDGALVHRLSFKILTQRLLRRLTDLYCHCCGERLDLEFPRLLAEAETVVVIEDDTRWVDLSSYSRRREASSPIGGLQGEIAFEGSLEPFLPLLVWGQFTHVGKDVTKGNGWYEIRGQRAG
ncbi:MAG: CRISPR system precrRNA processing endoribonuclease RAMP protein Cas6 [Methanotrichaceae archaeon]|nr:CRISPR system precrRNA processing endoribonuclease RAMP protein Cas6 [Methanotrichaceae archaeon]